ncbi:MAG: SpoIIE family protein phosphatase [Phycisphaerales bacterium]
MEGTLLPESPELLVLRPINRTTGGDPLDPLVLRAPGPYIVGRSSEADWAVPDQRVSRRHASLTLRDGCWFVADLGSRHGTTINGARLEEHESCPIEHGDLVGLGAWMCRCLDQDREVGHTTPFTEFSQQREQISAVDRSRLGGVAQRGLNALLELSRAVDHATDEGGVARAVVVAVQESTGCPRVVVTRPVSDSEFEVLASTANDSAGLSRSLMDAAADEGLVELRVDGAPRNQAHSIVELNIRSAICAAIRVGETPAAFLVIDTRQSERELPADAAAFCESVAHIAGLAFQRIHNAEIAARHAQLESDMGAARRAQELLMPPPTGKVGGVDYVFESSAGRVVAGDFFDIFALPSESVAFVLGDVSGKGMGAAVLMAAAQSQLRAHMLSGGTLAEAVAYVNLDLFRRTESSKFITLVAGVIDSTQGTLEIADAGHGLHALVDASGTVSAIDTPGGFPLGVAEQGQHEIVTVPFSAGSLFVTFSDGVVEQPDRDGRQYGLEAAMAAIGGLTDPGAIVRALVTKVREHARGPLADDLTVAAIQTGSQA